jgi:hypothetical protein
VCAPTQQLASACLQWYDTLGLTSAICHPSLQYPPPSFSHSIEIAHAARIPPALCPHSGIPEQMWSWGRAAFGRLGLTGGAVGGGKPKEVDAYSPVEVVLPGAG